MTFTPLQKGTILILSGPTEHLHFICSNPAFNPKTGRNGFLAVNLSSINPGLPYDPTCVLTLGDHPFVRHDSYIYYAKADIWGEVTTAQQVAQGAIRVHQPCGDAVFQRILDGFAHSPHVRPNIRTFYQRHCC